VVNDGRIDDALAHGGGHAELEYEQRREIEESSQQDRLARLQHPGRDHGRNGIRGIVETVHKIERQCDQDEHDHDSQADLDGLHRGLCRTLVRQTPYENPPIGAHRI